MKQYKILKNKDNIFYSYAVVDKDDVNKCPICYTTTGEEALLIATALNRHFNEKGKE